MGGRGATVRGVDTGRLHPRTVIALVVAVHLLIAAVVLLVPAKSGRLQSCFDRDGQPKIECYP